MDGPAVNRDPFGCQLQVGAGGAAGAAGECPHEGFDHPHGGGFAVGAGHVDRGEGTLGVAQEVHEQFHAVQGRVDFGFRPAGV